MTDVTLGPAVVNLKGIVENDNWSIPITLTSGGTPVNLTGAVLVAKIKTSAASIPLTAVVTGALAGELTVSLTDSPAIGSSAKWALRINNKTWLAGSASGVADVLA